MVFRIIYRPSQLRKAVTLTTVERVASDVEPHPVVLESGPVAKQRSRSQRVVIRSTALLMVRLGFAAMVMAAWRIAADLGLPLPFVIKTGLLTHWQVWFGAAVLLIGSAGVVARRLQFGKDRDGNSDRAEEAA